MSTRSRRTSIVILAAGLVALAVAVAGCGGGGGGAYGAAPATTPSSGGKGSVKVASTKLGRCSSTRRAARCTCSRPTKGR